LPAVSRKITPSTTTGRALVVVGDAAVDVVQPSAAERLDVRAVDLLQRRVVLVAEIAADLRKVFVPRGAAAVEIGGSGECRGRCGDGARRQQDGGEKLQFHGCLRLINVHRHGDAQVLRPHARVSRCRSMETRRSTDAPVSLRPSDGFRFHWKERFHPRSV
jgi:hypothetical protein